MALSQKQQKVQLPGTVSALAHLTTILNNLSHRAAAGTDNPTYSSTAPSTQYSSHGPQDTPPNTSPTAETPFSTYDIIGSPVAGRHAPSQEAVYNVLEGPLLGGGVAWRRVTIKRWRVRREGEVRGSTMCWGR